ncbi:MAG: hypothetical protein IKT00_14575 [Prevotella sp.]|nr:hypothetical protein [Prevotella sp.]
MKKALKTIAILLFAWAMASCTKENDPSNGGNGGNGNGNNGGNGNSQYDYTFGYYHPAKKVHKIYFSSSDIYDCLEFVWDGDDLSYIIEEDSPESTTIIHVENDSDGRISCIWDSTNANNHSKCTFQYFTESIEVQGSIVSSGWADGERWTYKIIDGDVYCQHEDSWGLGNAYTLIGHIDEGSAIIDGTDQACNPFKDLMWYEYYKNSDIRYCDFRYNHGAWAYHNKIVSGNIRYRYEYDNENYPIACWKTDPNSNGGSEKLDYRITYFPIGINSNSSGSLNGHEYVDLGLPSRTLWATCNVGAETPESNGDWFAWGETQPKSNYWWSTYRYGNDMHELTKYCNNSVYGYHGFTDNLTTLQASDDAATANWGSGWRTPTKDEWEELLNNTTIYFLTNPEDTEIKGCLFAGINGNSIYLPRVYCSFGGLATTYWSSSLASPPDYASGLYGNGLWIVFISEFERIDGLLVRPVCSTQ